RRHPAPLDAGRHDRHRAGDDPAARRISHSAASRRRQGVFHRQRAGRPVSAIAQLAVRLGDRRDAGPGRSGRPRHRNADRLALRRYQTSRPDLMRTLVFAVYLFLYTPIALVVLFSFNAGRNASEFVGFSVEWYGKAFSNTFLVQALQNSLIIAFTSAALAAVFGTMAALAIERMGARMRLVFDGLFAAAIVVP